MGNFEKMFNSNSEINFTLLGYANKILTSFLAKQTSQFIQYLAKNTKLMTLIFKHIYSDSILELINKIIELEHQSDQVQSIHSLIITQIFEVVSNPNSKQMQFKNCLILLIQLIKQQSSQNVESLLLNENLVKLLKEISNKVHFIKDLRNKPIILFCSRCSFRQWSISTSRRR